MKKYIFILMGVLSIFFFDNTVNAESLGEKYVNFVVNSIKAITGDGSIVSEVKSFADYNPNLSLFDGFELSIPVCNKDTTINDNGFITSSNGSNKVCYKGTKPNINTLITYLPYLIRYEYKIKDTDIKYYVWTFYHDLPYITSKDYIYGYPDFVISTLPEGGFFTTKNGEVLSLESSYKMPPSGYICSSSNPSSGVKNTSTFCSPFPFNTSTWDVGTYFLLDNSNPYFDINVSTNFDLKKENNVVVDSSTGTVYNFNTDVDIKLGVDEYLDLIPKLSNDFSTNIYVDNLFSFSYVVYDKLNKTYSSVKEGALSEINLSAMGGFNWLSWNVSFNDLDLTLNPIIKIFNANDIDLHIKFSSEYFDYKIMNKNSSEYCINGICYSNNYDDMYNLGHSFTYKTEFDTEDYKGGLSFIKNIPSMITDFTKSFAFIGLLITTVFTIFTGSLANYFYIIFGIMIIMLIIKILK